MCKKNIEEQNIRELRTIRLPPTIADRRSIKPKKFMERFVGKHSYAYTTDSVESKRNVSGRPITCCLAAKYCQCCGFYFSKPEQGHEKTARSVTVWFPNLIASIFGIFTPSPVTG